MGFLTWWLRRKFSIGNDIPGYKKYIITNLEISGSSSTRIDNYTIDGLRHLFFIFNLRDGNGWKASFYREHGGTVNVNVHIISSEKKMFAVLYAEKEKHYNDDGKWWRHYIIHLYVPIGVAKNDFYIHPDWNVVE